MNEGTRSGKSTIRLLGISAERPTNGLYLSLNGSAMNIDVENGLANCGPHCKFILSKTAIKNIVTTYSSTNYSLKED
jgi:hypothetical protein